MQSGKLVSDGLGTLAYGTLHKISPPNFAHKSVTVVAKHGETSTSSQLSLFGAPNELPGDPVDFASMTSSFEVWSPPHPAHVARGVAARAQLWHMKRCSPCDGSGRSPGWTCYTSNLRRTYQLLYLPESKGFKWKPGLSTTKIASTGSTDLMVVIIDG